MSGRCGGTQGRHRPEILPERAADPDDHVGASDAMRGSSGRAAGVRPEPDSPEAEPGGSPTTDWGWVRARLIEGSRKPCMGSTGGAR